MLQASWIDLRAFCVWGQAADEAVCVIIADWKGLGRKGPSSKFFRLYGLSILGRAASRMTICSTIGVEGSRWSFVRPFR